MNKCGFLTLTSLYVPTPTGFSGARLGQEMGQESTAINRTMLFFLAHSIPKTRPKPRKANRYQGIFGDNCRQRLIKRGCVLHPLNRSFCARLFVGLSFVLLPTL